MRGFRKILRFLLPHWARDDEADGAFAWVLAALTDVQIDRARRGVEQRFPSRAGASALALIGKYRLIPRGRDETDAHYASRLQAWRYPRGHRVRGNVFALLEQIQEYFGGSFDLWGIDASGNRRELSSTGAASFSYGNAWTWDSLPSTSWARQWIVIDGSSLFLAQHAFGDEALWGGAPGTEGYCIGLIGASAQDWAAISALTQGQHRWLPAGTRGEWLVVSLDGADPVPDSAYAKWGQFYDPGGGYTYYLEARASAHRYVALRSAAREYAGDADWASRALSDLGTVHAPDGVTTIKGEDNDFPLTITLPDGEAFAGSALFPATITLPDDGCLP